VSGREPTYEERLAQVAGFLASKRAIVLATCGGDRVSARTVSFASKGVDIWFMSFVSNTKCQQINANPNVALCRDNVQIEGTAQILGPVMHQGNAEYADALRAKYPEDYVGYANHPEMVLVRVVPLRIGVYRKEGNEHLVDRLDIKLAALSVEHLAKGGR